ncbi:MAG: LL-diaminopimelate aminotransferase [Candidatus Omnitrophica bacterium]|nr:LL-diaminopimelate aminotransferase [Candidatus Omnitrophota bacterium]
MLHKTYASERIKALPPYLFVEIDRIKKRLLKEGRDIIDLGIGDPDLATPDAVISELYSSARKPENHQYPLDLGLSVFRTRIAEWFKMRFNVELNSDTEIIPLLGSKEGIAHFPLAVIDPADLVLIPEPLYPPYRSGAIFSGAKIKYLPLNQENNFMPDLESLSRDVLKKTKLLYLNYPNNPTAQVADKQYLEKAVSMANEFGFIILYDAAYSELSYDGYVAPSILEIKGAREVAIEFHSFSKTFNMTGWRIGWACGNSDLIEYLRQVKSNIDSGVFNPIQYAAIKALDIYDKHIAEVKSIYRQRRDIFIGSLFRAGWNITPPKATFYIWAKIPSKLSSQEFCKLLLEKCFIIATPGLGFGPSGEGYVRFSLVKSIPRLEEAARRIAEVL